MARQVVFDAYGDEAYTRGLTVWTTIRRADQDAAYAAVRKGVIDYDRRHGYRGPEGFVNLGDDPAEQEQALDSAFGDYPDSDGPVRRGRPAGVAGRGQGGAGQRGPGQRHRRRAQVRRARLSRTKTPANQKLRRGAVIQVTRDDKGRTQLAGAAGRGRVPLARSGRRRDPLAGRRLRLRPQASSTT
jgi:penicillin-binding protein 1A